MAEEGFERGKLVVHRDAQGLKNTAHAHLAFLGRLAGEPPPHSVCEFGRGRKVSARQRRRQLGRVRFVGVFLEQRGEVCGARFREECRRRLAALRIEPHVERAFHFRSEAARRIVELHRGHAEISEDAVGARESRVGENARQAGEVAAVRGERLRAESEFTKARFGLGQFDGIGVESEQPTAGLDARENFPRMATETERAIDRDRAGLRSEDFENLGNHDRAMRARGCLAGREHFRHRLRVTLRIALLVFLLEAPRIFSRIARPAAMRCGFWRRVGHGWKVRSKQ